MNDTTADYNTEKWGPLQSQELKFAELGIRYDSTTTCSAVVDYRNERREKLREQDRERSRLKEEEEQKREAMVGLLRLFTKTVHMMTCRLLSTDLFKSFRIVGFDMLWCSGHLDFAYSTVEEKAFKNYS